MRVKDVSVKLVVWRGVLAAALAMPLLELVTPAVRVPMLLPRFEARSADRSDPAAQASAARHFPRSSSASLEVNTEPLRIAEASKTPATLRQPMFLVPF